MPFDYVAILNDAKTGNWDAAHRQVQEIDTAFASRIHAFLHRQEGDLGNAAYWYRRAQVPIVTGSLSDELDSLFKSAEDPHAEP